MYDTMIAGGGRILLLSFVVHLQDVWRRVNGALPFFLADAWTHC